MTRFRSHTFIHKSAKTVRKTNATPWETIKFRGRLKFDCRVYIQKSETKCTLLLRPPCLIHKQPSFNPHTTTQGGLTSTTHKPLILLDLGYSLK